MNFSPWLCLFGQPPTMAKYFPGGLISGALGYLIQEKFLINLKLNKITYGL
jgi:hypothetical protein